MTDHDTMSASTVRIARATPADLSPAVAVQHRAFMRVARLLDLQDPCDLPPVAETVDEVADLVTDRGASVFVARMGEGSDVRGPWERSVVRSRRTETVEIGWLAVEDGMEGRGIGRALMVAVEDAFPEATRFVLFTGRDAKGPVHLYESLGYTVVGGEEMRPGLHLVWMEKCRQRRVDSTP